MWDSLQRTYPDLHYNILHRYFHLSRKFREAPRRENDAVVEVANSLKATADQLRPAVHVLGNRGMYS